MRSGAPAELSAELSAELGRSLTQVTVGLSEVLGIGVDLVEVARMRAVISRTPRFTERVFSDEERSRSAAAPDPAPHFAARFAAKEAVVKALGARLFSGPLAAISVTGGVDLPPEIHLQGAWAALAAERGVVGWRVSMTHTDTMAAAIVVALGAR